MLGAILLSRWPYGPAIREMLDEIFQPNENRGLYDRKILASSPPILLISYRNWRRRFGSRRRGFHASGCCADERISSTPSYCRCVDGRATSVASNCDRFVVP